MKQHPFGTGTLVLSAALVSCLVACKKEPADLPPQTTFDEKGMPTSDQAFTPAEIHRDEPRSLDTANLSPKPPQPASVAKTAAPEARATAVAAKANDAVASTPTAKTTPAKKEPAAVPPAPPKSAPVVAAPAAVAGDVAPRSTGEWVLQVNVHRSQAEAEAQIAKLAKDGIPAYTVAFQAGEEHLSGSYWRVRVGRFASRADAQKYGTSVLEPKGLKFWIDKKSNENKQGNR